MGRATPIEDGSDDDGRLGGGSGDRLSSGGIEGLGSGGVEGLGSGPTLSASSSSVAGLSLSLSHADLAAVIVAEPRLLCAKVDAITRRSRPFATVPRWRRWR
uniref:Uncharacterized protein n=1 Tax=Oryza meridionalis TaxID=40149 RepID=A0A0E0D3Z2_9ORYZ